MSDINDFENGPATPMKFPHESYWKAAEAAYSATAQLGGMEGMTRRKRFSKLEQNMHKTAHDAHRNAAHEAEKAGYKDEEAYHDRMADLHGRTLREGTFEDQISEEMTTGAVPANKTGDSAEMAMPPTGGGPELRRARLFKVSNKTFRNFQPGRAKWDRWSNYLDKSVKEENELYEFASKNPDQAAIIQDSETGAFRVVRRVDTNYP